MAKDVYMPALGMNQETGILLRWLKKEGDDVTKGEPLMEIATDKTDVEIEAPASGVLRRVSAKDGDEIPVGQVMAVIAGPDEELEPTTASARASRESSSESAPDTAASQNRADDEPVSASPVAVRVAAEHGVDLQQIMPASGSRIGKDDVLAFVNSRTVVRKVSPSATRIPASPKARRLAAEAGLDLAQITPSGPEGAVLAADVLEAAANARQPTLEPQAEMKPAVHAATEEPELIPMSRMWRVMVERLSESWKAAPHFYLARDVDASKLVAWYEELSARSTVTITYTDLLVKIVSTALGIHPRLNARWENSQIVQTRQVNVGLAVAVADGLIVPVVHDARRMQLQEIAQRRQYLVDAAKNGTLAPTDLQGGTFTISNLGMYGIDSFSAIINPPQAAILAVGRIAERVVAENGQAVVKPMMSVNLSCDHRVVDGARAADFLRTMAQFCVDPLRMLE